MSSCRSTLGRVDVSCAARPDRESVDPPDDKNAGLDFKRSRGQVRFARQVKGQRSPFGFERERRLHRKRRREAYILELSSSAGPSRDFAWPESGRQSE